MDNRMQDSFFRKLMDSLKGTELNDRQAAPDWHRVIRRFLEVQVNHEISINRQYTGKQILIDRSDMNEREPDSERNACLNLYQQVLAQEGRSLRIENDVFRLIGYEVPNQYNLRGRRADLLGVNSGGELVVFEAKLNQKAGTPFFAVLEGLGNMKWLFSLQTTTIQNQCNNEFKMRTGHSCMTVSFNRIRAFAFDLLCHSSAQKMGSISTAVVGCRVKMSN